MNNIQQCSVTALACSMNWSLVATGRTIEVSTPDGVPLYKYCGHEGLISSVAFAPNGCVVASCDQHEVQVWNTCTGLLKWHRRAMTEFSSVLWSPNGKHIAASDLNGLVTLWDRNGQKMCECHSGCRSACGMNWSPCGQFLAIGSDGTQSASILVVADTRLVECVSCGGDVGRTREVVWSPDGLSIALVGGERLYTWPISDLSRPCKLSGMHHNCMISKLVWTSNYILFGDESGRVFTWSPWLARIR